MIIQTLKLKNYRRYNDAYIEFPDGLFGIVGNNGAGKSTIIEAIAWAIYGVKGARTGKELIKREEANPDSDCLVELEFALGSDVYHVVRELRGKRQTPYAALYVNGDNQPEIVGINSVTDHLTKKLGMDYNSFFTSVFTKQKELDALSDLTPATRKKRILRLLQIDRIDIAIKNLRKDKKESEIRIDSVRNTFQDIDQLNAKLEELKNEKTRKFNVVKEVQKSVTESKISRSTAKKRRDVLEKKYKLFQSLNTKLKVQQTERTSNEQNLTEEKDDLKKLTSSKAELSKILPSLKPLKSIQNKKEKLDEVREKYVKKIEFENQIDVINNKINELKNEKISLEAKLKDSKNVNSKIREVAKNIKEYQKIIQKLTNKIEGRTERVKEYKKQKKELVDEFNEIKKLGPKSRCPRCHKIIGKDYPEIIQHFQEEIDEIETKIDSQNTEIKKFSGEHDEKDELLEAAKREEKSLSKMIKERIKDEENRQSVQKQIGEQAMLKNNIRRQITSLGKIRYDETLHNQLKESLKGLLELEKKKIEFEKDASRIPETEKSIKNISKTLQGITRKIEKTSKLISALQFDEDEYEDAKMTYEKVDTLFHKKEKELIEARNGFDATVSEIRNTDKQIRDERKKRRKIENEEKKIEVLKVLDGIFGDFRTGLISQIIPTLSVKSSDIFRKITNGRYPNMTLNENYDVLIEENGKYFPLGRFSGGEEDLASLCLRIAISQVIEERTGAAGLNFIVLDEIFGSQDERRKNNILKALNDLSSQFRQIILITHVEDIKDLLPYAFNVVENSDNTSKIITEGSSNMVLSN
ncbi:MAG: SMC family ATPase [Candidatus Nitrosotenuis sp.]